MSELTQKEMTAHIRNRIKSAGIKARVHMQPIAFSERVITVSVPAYEINFTNEETKQIMHIAKCNNLTFVRGVEIDPDFYEFGNTPKQIDFYMKRVR